MEMTLIYSTDKPASENAYGGITISCAWEIDQLGLEWIDYKDYNPSQKSIIFIKQADLGSLDPVTARSYVKRIIPNVNFDYSIIVFLDFYDPVNTKREKVHNLDEIEVWSSVYNHKKHLYLGPIWILMFYHEQQHWNQNFIDDHNVEEKDKLFLSLINFPKPMRMLFMKHCDSILMKQSLYSDISNGTYIDYSEIKSTFDMGCFKVLDYKVQRKQTPNWYYRTFFTILHETEPNQLFLTEKTLRCILHNHPFVFFGNQGFIDYLRFLGFKTRYFYRDNLIRDETTSYSSGWITQSQNLCNNLTKFIRENDYKKFFYNAEAVADRKYNKKFLLDQQYWRRKINQFALEAIKQTIMRHNAKKNK
jgi:hypothetical protein